MVAQGGSVAQVGSGELSVLRGAQRELRVAQVRSRGLRCAQWCSGVPRGGSGGPGGAQCCSRGPKGAQDKLRLAQYGSGGLKGAQDGSERGGGLRETQLGSSGSGELRVVQWCSGRHRGSSRGLKATQGV